MEGITKRTICDVHLTADQWELYAHKPGAEDAADKLNFILNDALTRKLSRAETRRVALRVMRQYQELGALDTEPLAVLEFVLDELYGKEGQ